MLSNGDRAQAQDVKFEGFQLSQTSWRSGERSRGPNPTIGDPVRVFPDRLTAANNGSTPPWRPAGRGVFVKIDEHSVLDVPAVLLARSRCRSRFISHTVEVSDRLSPAQQIIELAHQTGVVKFWEKFGAIDRIPSISPIPGFTHLTHLLDDTARAGRPLDSDLAGSLPTTSPHQQVSVRAEHHVQSSERAFVTSISLPLNRPYTGCHALITWATSRLARENSYSPTMLMSREPGTQSWRVAFASGTLFDNGLWLRDTVERPQAIVLHGASELYWSFDNGQTFSEPSEAQWETVGCSAWGMRCIFGADFNRDELRLAIWERAVGAQHGAVESWSLPLLAGSVPRLLDRNERPLREVLQHVAAVVTTPRDQSGPLRLTVAQHPRAKSWLNPAAWGNQSQQAEPKLYSLMEGEWHQVPLFELLLNKLSEAST